MSQTASVWNVPAVPLKTLPSSDGKKNPRRNATKASQQSQKPVRSQVKTVYADGFTPSESVKTPSSGRKEVSKKPANAKKTKPQSQEENDRRTTTGKPRASQPSAKGPEDKVDTPPPPPPAKEETVPPPPPAKKDMLSAHAAPFIPSPSMSSGSAPAATAAGKIPTTAAPETPSTVPKEATSTVTVAKTQVVDDVVAAAVDDEKPVASPAVAAAVTTNEVPPASTTQHSAEDKQTKGAKKTTKKEHPAKKGPITVVVSDSAVIPAASLPPTASQRSGVSVPSQAPQVNIWDQRKAELFPLTTTPDVDVADAAKPKQRQSKGKKAAPSAGAQQPAKNKKAPAKKAVGSSEKKNAFGNAKKPAKKTTNDDGWIVVGPKGRKVN